jgi:hypothetical protein
VSFSSFKLVTSVLQTASAVTSIVSSLESVSCFKSEAGSVLISVLMTDELSMEDMVVNDAVDMDGVTADNVNVDGDAAERRLERL